MNHSKILYLVHAAMIAALYVVLTMLANALGIASGNIQVRFSEALTVLPFFTPAAIPGLYIGCLLGNIVIGSALPDIIFGPIPTLIGAIGTWYLGRMYRRQNASAPASAVSTSAAGISASPASASAADVSSTPFPAALSEPKKGQLCKWLSPVPPILANAAIIPPVLKYAYGFVPVWFSVITVSIGEIISCGIFGLILLFALEKRGKQLFS